MDKVKKRKKTRIAFPVNNEAPVEAVALFYIAIFNDINPSGLQIEYNGEFFTITVESINHDSDEELEEELQELAICYDWWGNPDRDVPVKWRDAWEQWVKTLKKMK